MKVTELYLIPAVVSATIILFPGTWKRILTGPSQPQRFRATMETLPLYLYRIYGAIAIVIDVIWVLANRK